MGWTRRGAAVVVACLVAASTLGAAPDVDAVPHRICFPVAGRTSYVETFGAPRSGGRRHAGNDLFAARHTPLVAVTDGWLDYVKTDNGGLSGRAVGLIGVDGWKYRYIHLNNDNPGTDDGRAPVDLGIVPGLAPGSWVIAGQVIGWLGDSGNAETTPPHLHFEIRRPDGTPVTPYPYLRQAARCPLPWATDIAARPGGGAWVLTATGRVHAVGGAPFFGEPNWGWDIARSIAAMPDGNGYVVLDGWGGIHRYGSAAAIPGGTGYQRFRDLARSVDVAPNGNGIAVLWADGSVTVNGPLANVPPLDLDLALGGPRWVGDRGRGIEITDDGRGWVIVDVDGALHGSGVAAVSDLVLGDASTSWIGARGLALTPLGLGAHVLDSAGAVRPAGDAGPAGALPAPLRNHPWMGLDAAGTNRVVVRADGLVVVW